jgi:hypothetical protein
MYRKSSCTSYAEIRFSGDSLFSRYAVMASKNLLCNIFFNNEKFVLLPQHNFPYPSRINFLTLIFNILQKKFCFKKVVHKFGNYPSGHGNNWELFKSNGNFR